MLHDAQLLQRLARIKIVILDVDGVLTDGGIYLGESEEVKKFNVQDGAGIEFLRRSGIETAVVTGRASKCVARRCQELHIKELHQGVKNKLEVFEDILKRRQLQAEEAAAMGDDLPDLPMMLRAGISAAPAGAAREVRVRASVITHTQGGEGAVREFAELILRAQDRWHDILAPYLG